MIRDCKLTTIDNPFDPFDDFDSWFQFDTEHGYNSCSRLDRIAKIEDDMSSVEIDREIERAIDEIIFYDPIGIYKKVVREYSDDDEDDE
jgi:hypothetical protein